MAGWSSEHERAEALLSTYLDGRASQAERALVERHLKSCADCERNLATLRATVVTVRDLPHVRAPRSFALPRSMAKQLHSAPWLYPLLRTATAIATFLFVLVVAGDLYARFTPFSTSFSTSAPMAAPAALPPTSIAMQAAATPVQESAPQVTAPVAPPAPQAAVSLAPVTTASGARQAAATPASTSAAKAFGLAPVTEGTSVADTAISPATPVEPPTEQTLGNGGLGSGAGGVGQPPGIAAVAPTRALVGQAGETVTPQLTSTPLAAPTEVARAPALQPPVALEQGGAHQIQRPVVNPLRVAEGVLAIAVVALGTATWIVRRRKQ